MSLQTFDDYIARVGNKYYLRQPIWGEAQTITAALIASQGTMQRVGDTMTLPSLPSGVTAWIPTYLHGMSFTTGTNLLIAKVINLGSFDISNTTVGTFTDGSAMPTATVFNTSSTQLCSAVIAECTTATTGTQTTVTMTYTNQAGTANQTTTFAPVTASVVRASSFIALGGTDWGVQDITAVARVASAGPTGVIQFWGIIPISTIPILVTQQSTFDNLITAGVNVQRLGAGDTIKVFTFATGGVKAVLGEIYFVGDN